jgi:hypothetical protein
MFLGLQGSESVSQRHGVNVPSKRNKQKIGNNFFFFGILKVLDVKSRIRSWIWIRKSVVRIPGSGSLPKCHGSTSATLCWRALPHYPTISYAFFMSGHRVDRVVGMLFLQSSEMGSTTPSPANECVPHSFGSGGPGRGEGTHSRGRGCGGVSIPTRGQTLWYSRSICRGYFVDLCLPLFKCNQRHGCASESFLN